MNEPNFNEDAALVEMRTLTRTGATAAELVKCQALSRMVEEWIGVGFRMGPARQAELLEKVLYSVINLHRNKARKVIDSVSRQKSSNDRHVQVVAIGELIEISDEASFNEVKELRLRQLATTWKVLSEDPENTKTRRSQFELRAAIWLGYQGTRNIRYDRKIPVLLRALEDAIKEHLNDADARRSYAALIQNWNSEATQSSVEDGARSTSPRISDAIASKEILDRPDLTAKPIRLDRSLRDALDVLAEESRRRLREELFRGPGKGELDAIPVQWHGADERYFDPWERIHDQIGRTDSIPLSGMFASAADFYASVPSGRVVVLGGSGSGKTTLAMKIAHDLLSREHWSDGSPVPVVIGLQAWDDSAENLTDWLVQRLISTYPDLAHGNKRRSTLAHRLVKGGHILPILDSFDEVPSFKLRVKVISEVNRWLNGYGDRIILTSQPDKYYEVVDKEKLRVSRAPVVVLKSLEHKDIANYLRVSTRSDKWEPVIARMNPLRGDEFGSLLLNVLSKPLMAFLAWAIYQDSETDPRELLEFSDTLSMERHLLSSFVPVIYRSQPLSGDGVKCSPQEAVRWLGFLAHSMKAQTGDATSFAWWSAGAQLAGRILLATMFGLFGLVVALVVLGRFILYDTWPFILATPISIVASVIMFATISLEAGPATFDWRLLRESLKDGSFEGERDYQLEAIGKPENLFLLAFAGLWVIINVTSFGIDAPEVVIPAFVAFLVVAPMLFIALPYGPIEIESPIKLLRQDRRVTFAKAIFCSAIYASLVILTLIFDRNANPLGWLVAIPVVGSIALLLSASGAWFTCCLFLAMRKQFPLKAMRFLDDAHARGVLRQSGGVYQFRHALLQERLAWQFEKAGEGQSVATETTEDAGGARGESRKADDDEGPQL